MAQQIDSSAEGEGNSFRFEDIQNAFIEQNMTTLGTLSTTNSNFAPPN